MIANYRALTNSQLRLNPFMFFNLLNQQYFPEIWLIYSHFAYFIVTTLLSASRTYHLNCNYPIPGFSNIFTCQMFSVSFCIGHKIIFRMIMTKTLCSVNLFFIYTLCIIFFITTFVSFSAKQQLNWLTQTDLKQNHMYHSYRFS